MKQCPFCANVLNDNDEFCNNCGNKVSDTADVSKQPQDAKKKKESKGSKTALIIIIAILAVLLIGAVTVFVLDVTGVIDISAIFSGEEKVTQTQISMGEETSFEENTEDVTYGEADEPLDSGADGYFSTINVGTGGFGGTYYAFSCAAGNALSNDDYKFNVVSTDGSKSNILGINDGNYQMAICSGDVMNYAVLGNNTFEKDGKFDSFSAIGCIYSEVIQIVVPKSSGIKSIYELNGKKVAIGAAGSGIYFNALDFLDAAGMTIDDIEPVYKSFNESADLMKDGKIDAAFIIAGVPTPAVTEISRTIEVDVIGLPPEAINKLIKEKPYYCEYGISADAYDYMDNYVNTVCTYCAYIVTNDMCDEQVYEITKALWESEELKAAHAKGQEMNIHTALAGIGAVPLHPGAAKYYNEMGLYAENVPSFEKKPEIVDIPLTEEKYAIGVDINQPELLEDVNAFLEKIKSDGTLDEICNHYFGDGTPVPVKSATLDESKDQLVVATNAVYEPLEYKEGDKFLGIDMEIAALLADYLGKELVISHMDFEAVCLSVSQGKADIAIAGLTVKPEREEYVTFSDIYYDCSQVLIISSDDNSFDKSVTADDVIAVLEKNGPYQIIGVQTGTTGEFFVKGDEGFEFVGLPADCRTYRNCALALNDMLDGNINYVITDRSAADSIIK